MYKTFKPEVNSLFYERSGNLIVFPAKFLIRESFIET